MRWDGTLCNGGFCGAAVVWSHVENVQDQVVWHCGMATGELKANVGLWVRW